MDVGPAEPGDLRFRLIGTAEAGQQGDLLRGGVLGVLGTLRGDDVVVDPQCPSGLPGSGPLPGGLDKDLRTLLGILRGVMFGVLGEAPCPLPGGRHLATVPSGARSVRRSVRTCSSSTRTARSLIAVAKGGSQVAVDGRPLQQTSGGQVAPFDEPVQPLGELLVAVAAQLRGHVLGTQMDDEALLGPRERPQHVPVERRVRRAEMREGLWSVRPRVQISHRTIVVAGGRWPRPFGPSGPDLDGRFRRS